MSSNQTLIDIVNLSVEKEASKEQYIYLDNNLNITNVATNQALVENVQAVAACLQQHNLKKATGRYLFMSLVWILYTHF
ncbi:Uncharacterised protein [Legionella busanensis]|uniref:Uncharacterized protein n=1 Tax=Legionella busanensis TaxID=190655 RepID=A0A378JKX9_9GAMM|nr:hypothetical protein [Legionella busanensis]STX50770.1 Uncharacterised protein [Legionella busanensis]